MNNKIPLYIYLLGLFIVFVFASNNRFISIADYFYLPLLIIIIILFEISFKRVKFHIEHFAAILFIIVVFMNTTQIYFNTGVFLNYVIYILLFLLLILTKSNEKIIRFEISCYIASGLIISFLLIFFRREYLDWENTYRYTIQVFDHNYIDPNFLASFIFIPAAYSLYRFYLNKKIFFKILYLLSTLMISFGVMLTASRGATVVLFFLLVLISLKNSKSTLMVIIVVSMFLLIIQTLLPDGNVVRLFQNSYDNQNSRLLNWEYGFYSFLKKPLFGYGTVDSATVNISNFGYYGAAHNTFIMLLINFGLIGSIPFFILIINLINKIYKTIDSYLYLGIIFSLLALGVIIELNVTITLWINLIMLYQVVQLNQKKVFNRI